jgi:basic membrane protein A and related proteins
LRISRWAAVIAVVTICVGAAALGMAGSGNAKPTAGTTVALVSDIGKFTDKGFNQSQLAGLNKAKAKLGITAIPLQSNSTSDYSPNFNTAIRKGAKLVIAAGFLLASTEATYAKQFPNVHFAITDDSVHGADFKGKSVKNIEGLTYAANQSGCLVGVLAAKKAAALGGDTVGAVGGLKIPPVDIWIAGYKFCAQKAVPGTKVLIQYSQDFVATDKCKTVATNEISQGAKVVFQVAGGCGLGVFKAADESTDAWAIGVDVDQYKLGKRVLTSGTKHVETGVFGVAQQEQQGKFKGGTDLNFNLKNGGMGIGKINPSVPKGDIALMNSYKSKIIAGTLKVPTAIK